ncbi:hypothetical protein GQ54DRAFT_295717 [Martensiomyces pterosporus]|nr:hypothetical protein GQ54DRAFT_295717 [Martensiomyces pterosporus]
MDDGISNVVSMFVQAAQEGYMFEDGDSLSGLFVFTSEVASHLSSQISDVDDFEPYTIVITDDSFGRFTAAYLSFVRYGPAADTDEQCRLMCRVADAFIPVFSRPGVYWLVPVMRAVAFGLFQAAQTQDKLTKDTAAHVQAASRLQSLLNNVLSDRDALPNSKHLGALFVAGLLIRVSMYIGAMPPAHAAVGNVAKAKLSLSFFTNRDVMAYRYWVGRYFLVCYRVEAARKELDYAFNACPAFHRHNKRAILRHLIVANMIRGRLPAQGLLEKYEMEPVYAELVRHFRIGNIAGFQAALVANMEFFRSQGNFLILLERTEILMYRNVLKQLARILANGERSKILTYSNMLAVFQVASQNFSMDVFEMESILASLISQKYVHGYLFHHQQVLNLSAKLPFPPIESVALPGGVKG